MITENAPLQLAKDLRSARRARLEDADDLDGEFARLRGASPRSRAG
jgi:hypothetical protein